MAREDAVIAEAIDILRNRLKGEGVTLSSPNRVKEYLICQFGTSGREIFSALWMDVRNRLIDHEILFYGTLDALRRLSPRSGQIGPSSECGILHSGAQPSIGHSRSVVESESVTFAMVNVSIHLFRVMKVEII